MLIQTNNLQREQARLLQCPNRRIGPGSPSCGTVTVDLGFEAGMSISECDKCWGVGPSTVDGGEARDGFKQRVISHLCDKKSKPPTAVILTLSGRHLTPEPAKNLIRLHAARMGAEATYRAAAPLGADFEREMRERFDAYTNQQEADALDPSTRWALVGQTWEKAASYLSSLKDDFTGEKVDDQTYRLRVLSCSDCPSRVQNDDGSAHCADCGCGSKKRAKLDKKLWYKLLACPRRRRGFANEQGNTPINVKKDLVDRAICINLDKRPERWDRFIKNTEQFVWPFPPIVRVPGVEGDKVPKPHGWNHGSGTYGCRQSHVRVLEDAIMTGVESILIMEDDAYFPDDFPLRLREFLDKVPADWDGIMLGGQHMDSDKEPPEQVVEGVVRCRNGQRTHAFIVRGKYMRALYQEWATKWGHVDHLMGPLHKTWKVYAPDRFIVGQYGGSSDISGRENTVNFWNSLRMDDPTICVLGIPFDGSHHLVEALRLCGVHFGNNRGKFLDEDTVDGGLVDLGLHAAMSIHYPFPAVVPGRSPEGIVSSLAKWRKCVGSEAANMEVPLGVYHPQIGLLGDAIEGVFGNNTVRVCWRGRGAVDAFAIWCDSRAAMGLSFGIAKQQARHYGEVLWGNTTTIDVRPEDFYVVPEGILTGICTLADYKVPESLMKEAVNYVKGLTK